MNYSRVLEWIFRLVLAGVFLVAGYEKARDPIQFLLDIRSFHLLPDPYAGLLALGLPWLELLCAAGVVLKRLYVGSVAILSASLAVFIVVIAWSWHRGLDISCGCFGKTDLELGYFQHLVLNATLLGMGLWLLWRESRSGRESKPA